MFSFFKNKNVSVIGIGVSNTPLIKTIVENGGNVVARDKKNAEQLGDIYNELNKLGVKFILGEKYLENIEEELIFKSPGIRFDIPELVEARKKGYKVTSEMEMFIELCPADIIGISGSDGKTTTTTLIYEILKKEGYKCWLGGNIGIPLFSKLNEIKSEDKVILELSSFQLQTIKKSPKIAVLTNITPNHLDYHIDMQEYIDAKKNLFKYQDKDGKLVLNFENNITKEMVGNGETVYFSINNLVQKGVRLIGEEIYYDDKKILNINDIRIPGRHNVENYMAAIAAVYGMASIESIEYIAKNFGGVEHRIEFVRELDGVKYYNDSIASSPTRSKAGLLSFSQKVIMIAGGYDKKIPFDELGEIINERVKILILIGKTAPKIRKAVEAVNKDFCIIDEADLKSATLRAKSVAKNGDVVILSPACASFDMFKNFEERGNLFKEFVNKL